MIDPGCNSDYERNQLLTFIDDNSIKITSILLTHGHIDHILGLNFITNKYNLIPMLNSEDIFLLDSANKIAELYGIKYDGYENKTNNIEDKSTLNIGNIELECIHVPGHSPGSICFYNKSKNILIAGDVLFNMSIGRTDLPGGNYEQLITGIQKRLFTLPEETIVYPGHGIKSSIGHEKYHNPFF
ncbi:MAG: MBL fold metallo-hydrolase [Saprospiraceae bacterium]